jgi:radical SAM protein with 4Fe4S-binding SPASM domain
MGAGADSFDNNLKAGAWDSAKSMFGAHAARKHVPMFGTFELTARCNFSCKMCYVHTVASQAVAAPPPKELSAKEWLHLAEEARESGMLYLLLTGGEPLIRSDFTEIYTELSKMGFMVFLNTNASLLDDKYAELLAKYPPTATAVTLYGADRETCGKVCGNPDFFDQTIRGLERLAQIPTLLEVRTTFIKDNMHQLDQLREIANRYTHRYAINPHVFKAMPGVISYADECRMSVAELYDLSDRNRIYYRDLNAKKEAMRAVTGETVPQKIDAHLKGKRDNGMNVPPAAITCLASKAVFWISCDGRMLPCGTFVKPYTLPLEEGFQAAWDRLPGLYMDLKYPDKCLACEYFDHCPNCLAFFQVETGSFEEIPEYICGMAKERHIRYIAKKENV